jgi:hypothetical protein
VKLSEKLKQVGGTGERLEKTAQRGASQLARFTNYYYGG